MSTKSDLASNLTQTLRADPKKAGALAVLAILFVAMVGRQFLSSNGKATPGTASASMAKPNEKASVSAKQTSFGGSAPRGAGASAALQKWLAAPVPSISRNLFTVRMEYFPMDGSRTLLSDATEEGFWAKLEKSMAVQADQKYQQDNLRANFKAQAEKLRVESTMPGPQPRAMVNGELVGEGSVVAGFRVLKIEARRITIEREGIQLEIQMK